MGFNTEQTKSITASFFQEVCHAVLRVPVPMIHSDCHINEGDEEKLSASLLSEESPFPEGARWLEVPIHFDDGLNFKIRASSEIGIAFPGLWQTLSKGICGKRLLGKVRCPDLLRDRTVYLSNPDFEHLAPPGKQEHWPLEMSESPFQAIHAWMKSGTGAPILIAAGLEGQGLVMLS